MGEDWIRLERIGKDWSAISANWSIGFKSDVPLLMVLDNSVLIQVGMQLNLVDDRLDLASSQKVDQHGDSAIADCNALYETLLDKILHLLPDDMEGRRSDFPLFLLLVDWQQHPVNHVHV